MTEEPTTNEPTDEEISQAVDAFLQDVKDSYLQGANLLGPDWIHGAIAEDPKTGKEYLIIRLAAPDYVEVEEGKTGELNLAFEEEAAHKLMMMIDFLGHKIWGADEEDDEDEDYYG